MNTRNNLCWRFLRIIIPLIVIAFVVLIGLYESLSYSHDKTALKNKLDHLTENYSLLLADPVAGQRADILKLYKDSLTADPDVVAVTISNSRGEVLEQYGLEQLGLEQRAKNNNGAQLFESTVIIERLQNGGAEKVGVLNIVLSARNILDALIERLQYEFLLLITLIAVVLVTVKTVYAKTIGDPLENLSNSIASFQRFRQHKPVEYKNNDELGDVIKQFNDMQLKQMTIQEELKNQYNSQERMVAERTKELESELSRHAETTSKLYNEKQRAQITLNAISDSVITANAEGIIEFMNPAAYKMLDNKKSFSEGRPFSDVFQLMSIESRDPVTDLVAWCLESENKRCPPIEFYLQIESGKEYIVEAMLSALVDVNGNAYGVVILIRDITTYKNRNTELSYLAQHDMLTGLVNRREFESRLERLLDDSRLSDRQHVLFYLDLDRFKAVNDTCGHAAGDKVLKLLSEEFKNHLRKEDCIGRLGGDEFGVLLVNCNINSARTIGEKMRQDIDDFEFEWEGKIYKLGVSIGIVAITRGA